MNRFLHWFQFGSEVESTPENLHYAIRERILTAVLIVSAVLGAVAYLVNLRTMLPQRVWGWISIYTMVLLWVVAIALARKIPYPIRAYSLLALLYALGVVSALQYGAAGDARIWFLGITLLASVFLGLWEGLGALALTTLTYLGIGWAMNQSLIAVPPPDNILYPDIFSAWTTTGAAYFAIGAIIALSIIGLVHNLNANIRKVREYAAAITIDRETLEERTKVLERRDLQIRTAAEISRTAVSELDPEVFFQHVVDLMKSRFDLYYAGVFTLDESGRYAVLRAGTGEAGRQMLANKHKLAVGSTSMIGYAISHKEARIASDVEAETIRFVNPYLPETRSELALPMISGEQALGAITVQSTRPNAFDENDITVFQGIADSLAIALENARLFQQLQSSLEEIQKVHRQYVRQSWAAVTARTHGISYTYDRAEQDETQQSGVETSQPTTLELPLVLRNETIGRLSLETTRPALTPQESAFVEAVIQQTALALENIRLVDETQRAAQQDRVISAISGEFSRAMDVEQVIRIAVRELGRLPDISEVSVHIEPTPPAKD